MLIGFILIILFLNKFKAIHGQSLNVWEIIGLVHGAICQQGSTIVLILNSIKIVVFVLFFTTFFLFNAYSASIVSLFQSTSSSINSVKDLYYEKSMTMSIQIATYAKPYFNETTNEILRKLYDMKIKPYDESKSFTNASMGIERIRTEFHGFMVEKTSAYQVINKKWSEEEKCGLYEIQLFKLPVLAIPVVKKSGHKDVFKQKLIQQHEVGIRKRVIQRWTPQKPLCDLSKRNKKYVSVSIKAILPTIMLFGYGLLISLTVFMLELAYYYFVNYINSRIKKSRQ
ncbi:glutamate receptor ionotropic, delta-1-like [Rhopalosiphum padi]|uniref:glutamate receptor ionotropic, delta-1-like n=1 Tax=Rhopalosiphum padi TaxID=40932 RepID=UPI00298D8E96|nr:glutamate receptor ionotropic, delta-1-like [Rhopalosiphum padi]